MSESVDPVETAECPRCGDLLVGYSPQEAADHVDDCSIPYTSMPSNLNSSTTGDVTWTIPKTNIDINRGDSDDD